MIDLRSHILDGTPCGPDSFADSLEMSRAAAADGVRTVVATPRWEAGSTQPPLPFDECRHKLERLEEETRGALSFKLGFVFQYGPELPELAARHGSKLALAGKQHLLVSLPSVEIPNEVEGVWKSLRRCGLSVVLAHPECNTVLRRDSARLTRWVSEGMTLQVDAASVLGMHGREVQRFALDYLRKYEGHAVVASNMRRSGDQRPSLANARQELADKLGARQTRKLVRDTAAAVLGELGARPVGGRGGAGRGFTSAFRSFGPVKALMGDS